MLKNVLTEILYVLIGLVCLYSAVKTARNKDHPARWTTSLFWGILFVVFTFSRLGTFWGDAKFKIPDVVVGYLVIVLAVLSALKKVKMSGFSESTADFKQAEAMRIGNPIFVPALALGVVTFLVAQFFTAQLGSLVALGIGALVSGILALAITKGKAPDMMEDGSRLLETVGPVSMLPQILAALGSVFAAAGVGTLIADGMKTVIPAGNQLAGVVVYCVGMALFTVIMGNAFAAFAVITAGIGIPFVIAAGGNPVVVSALGLTAGYCGTLLTPMAANFNIVPTAILEISDKRWGVIKHQLPVALTMLAVHVVLMYVWAF